jgi:delta 1-pyrroline-5-carboxylate dehydrogenase
VLVSAPDAGGYVGPGWFKALVATACEAVPGARCSSLLDCGDNTGAALAAIRAEVEGVIFTGAPDVADRLAENFFAPQEDLEKRCAGFLG